VSGEERTEREVAGFVESMEMAIDLKNQTAEY
jgi:hypothetical protein